MPWFAFVGPALRLLNTGAIAVLRPLSRGVSMLAGKSDDNPKTSAAVTVLGAAAAYFNIDPSSLATAGKALVYVGMLVQRLGQ